MNSASAALKLMKGLKRFSRVLPEWILTTKARGLLQLGNAMLFEYGWLRSRRQGKPVDADGNPLPWITYPCIDFLKQFDYKDKSVFEWGAGQSTLFWAARAMTVISVEADPIWFEMLKNSAPQNCEIWLRKRELGPYVSAIAQSQDKFDVISIDGPGDFRPACSEAAVKHLRSGGFVILDNSDQSLKSAKILRNSGLLQVDFTGFVPGLGYPHTTSIFFDRAYSFQTISGIQPERSVGQPNLPWPDA